MPYELIADEPLPQSESGLGYGLRTGARTLARGAESIAGFPGDIAGGVLNLANYGIGKLTGKESPLPARTPIPTSEDIKKHVTKPLSGEYLEPQSYGESFYDDIIGDAATLFLPLKSKVPFSKALTGALGRSAVGNIAKWAAEDITGSPLAGTVAKIGSMALAGTVGGRKELNTLKEQSYKDAFAKIPDKAKFNLSPERSKLDKLITTFKKGDKPDKDIILQRLNAAENIIGKDGRASIKDIIGLKQDWNAHLRDPKLAKPVKDVLKQGVGMLNDSIKRYGEKNSAFYNPYKIGEELTGALQGSSYIQKVLSKNPYLQESVSNPLVSKLVFGGALTGSKALGILPQVGAAGAAAYGTHELAKAYQLLAKSPVARNYYKNVMQSALKDNPKAVAKDLARFDKFANYFVEKNPELAEGFDNQNGRYELLSD